MKFIKSIQAGVFWSALFFLISPVLAGVQLADVPVVGDTPREYWMGTYFKGQKLGFSHSKVQKVNGRLRVDSKVHLQLKTEAGNQTTSFSQVSELTPDLKVTRFSLLQELMGHRQKIDAEVKGGKLVYQIRSKGFDKTQSLPFSSSAALSSTFLFNVVADGLKVGKRGKLSVLVEPFQIMSDLDYKITRKENFEYQGQTLETFVMVYRMSGMESTLWVRPDGTVMRELTSQGFESRLEPEDKARQMQDGALSVSSLITLSIVKPKTEIANPGKKVRMKLELTHGDIEGGVPEDHRQKILKVIKNGEGKLTSTLLIGAEPYPVPWSEARPFRALKDPQYLDDSAEVQSKHPMIRQLAKELAGSTPDAWRAAVDIHRWVYSNLEKELVDATSALDALKDRRGECQSHTYLFTALARAAGIPTKIVNGLVYSTQFEGFLYHAWPEVYVGEWRALDPTLGQEQVDATHIKLSEGAEENPLKLMEYVGQVEIEVLEH